VALELRQLCLNGNILVDFKYERVRVSFVAEHPERLLARVGDNWTVVVYVEDLKAALDLCVTLCVANCAVAGDDGELVGGPVFSVEDLRRPEHSRCRVHTHETARVFLDSVRKPGVETFVRVSGLELMNELAHLIVFHNAQLERSHAKLWRIIVDV